MTVSDILEYGGAMGGTAIPDTLVLAREPAWHETGTVLDTNGEKGLTVEQALPASGLDFTVVKATLYAPKLDKAGVPVMRGGKPVVQDAPVDRRYSVIRTDTGYCLGVVGETWQPMQPIDGFQVINDVIEQAGGKCWIESAGSIDGGRKIWVLAHINEEMQIAGEAYRSYLLFTTGFDGRLSTTAAAIDMRVVCANTLNFALFGEAKESGYVVRVRHTIKAAERIKEAAQVLGMRDARAEKLAQAGEFMADSKMDDGKFNEFLQTLMPVPEGQEGKPAETMIKQRQDQVREIYMQAPNLTPIRGTTWGALQAVLEYTDHARSFNNPETQTKAQFGITAQPLKQQAFELALSFASAAD